jgi:MFS family permease
MEKINNNIFALGAFMMSLLNSHPSAAAFAITFFFFDGSFTFFQTPNNAAIISESKPEQRGLLSGLLNLSRNIGQTTGSALIGAIFYFFTGTKFTSAFNPLNVSMGIHNTFLISSAIMIVGFVIGLFTISGKKTI